MHRGEMFREVRTTQPEQSSHSFLEQAAQSVTDELGLDISRMREAGWLVTTEEEVDSPHREGPGTENWLRTLWFKDDRVAIALETRDVWNNVVTECVYLGIRPERHQLLHLDK